MGGSRRFGDSVGALTGVERAMQGRGKVSCVRRLLPCVGHLHLHVRTVHKPALDLLAYFTRVRVEMLIYLC